MRKLSIPLTLVLALLVGAAPAAAKTRAVKVGDDFFLRKGAPPTLTVRKGTTVKWRWVGKDDHNVVVQRGPVHFQSPLKSKGTFKKKLKKKGTYKIVCLIHQPDMRMKLKVR